MTDIRDKYARPIAAALIESSQFSSWFLSQTEFSNIGNSFRIMNEEQLEARNDGADNWWRNYYVTTSYKFFSECVGESPTYFLVIISDKLMVKKYALHIDIQCSGSDPDYDRLSKYKKRSECWVGFERNPQTVLHHNYATTIMCCSKFYLSKNAEAKNYFNSIITFEDISQKLKDIAQKLSVFPDP